MPPQLDKSVPRHKAKEVVLRHDFSGWNGVSHYSLKTGGYKTPNGMAQAMVDCYYQNPQPTAAPMSIAVSAIYVASLYFNCRHTHTQLYEEYGVASSTITKHSDHLEDRVIPPIEEE